MFNIATTFINKPVLASVVNIVIAVLGFVCFQQVTIREYPNIERKTISVSMEYAGASVDVVESQIAYRFEEALASLEGLKDMRSTITQGLCQIQLEFDISKNIDNAANEVEARLRRVRGSDMPENLREPVIEKTDPSVIPSFYLTLSGGNFGSSELGDIMNRYVKSELEAIPGVATVKIPGQTGTSNTYAIDVFMRPRDMASLKITPEEVFRALGTQSFIQPAGDIFYGNRSYRITLRASLSTIEEFKRIVVKEKNGKIVRVGDVADVQINDDERNQRNRYNGQVVAFCNVSTQPSANIINISKDIKAKLIEITKTLPSKDLKLELALDRSVYIKSSIKRLYKAIIEAVILVAIITFIFLKSTRATIIPLVSIPVCLLSGFFIMYLFGFTINIMTLLALLLGVGLVVDDSVVVVEKIISNIEKGMLPMQASIKGMNEIQSSIIGMTLTLVAVYLPISLSKSTVGKFFNEFAVTLAGIVLISGVVALTIAPALSGLILRRDDAQGLQALESFDKWFETVKYYYSRLLKWAFKNMQLVFSSTLFLTVLSLVVAKYFLVQIPEPEQDKNTVFLRLSTNHATLESVTPILEKLEEAKKHPAVKGILSDYQSGSDRASVTFILREDPTKRISCAQFIQEMKGKYDRDLAEFMPRYDVYTSPLAESNTFGVTIKSNKNYDEIEDMGQELIKVLSYMRPPYKTKNLQFSRTRPEKTFNIVPRRDRVYLLGARLEDVRNAIKFIMRGNPPADRYEKNGKQYPIRVWVSEEDRRNSEIVKQFFIRTSNRSDTQPDEFELVSLKELVEVENAQTRPLIIHEGSQRGFDIYCEFENKDIDMVSAYKEFEKRALKVLPSGFSVVPNRGLRKMIEEGNNIIVMIALALVFVYLIMAALFESFKDPMIVMCTVPLAVSWSLFSLKIFPDGSLNAYSYVAILTLIGLITKHGILLVEFFKQRLPKLGSVRMAVEEAALARFRPIIMTTLAMVLGAVPLLVSKGSGYEGPRQVGIVLVGGLTLGTIMTLLVIPCVCVLVTKNVAKDDDEELSPVEQPTIRI